MQSDLQDNSPLDELFNEQSPVYLAQAVNAVQSGERCAAIVSHNQLSDISDDIFCQSVTEVSKQPIALCR